MVGDIENQLIKDDIEKTKHPLIIYCEKELIKNAPIITMNKHIEIFLKIINPEFIPKKESDTIKIINDKNKTNKHNIYAQNNSHLLFRVPPVIIELLLIIFTILSFNKKKYVLFTGLSIIIYKILDWVFSSFTIAFEVDASLILNKTCVMGDKFFIYDSMLDNIIIIKMFGVDINYFTTKDKINNYIECIHVYLKDEFNLNNKELNEFVKLQCNEYYNDALNDTMDYVLSDKIKCKMIIYNSTTKHTIINKILHLIYLFGLTRKIYNHNGVLKNANIEDNFDLLYQ